MTYEITDNHHTLKLTLTSDEVAYPILEVYVNDDELPIHATRYSSLSANSPFVYEIPHSDFNIGDVITKFKLIQGENVLPWETHEGVTILIDGEEVTNLNSSNCSTITGTNRVAYTTQFSEGTHDIQAVYVGNNEYNMSMTDKLHFIVSQPEVDEEGDPENSGAYRLSFYNTVPKSTVYDKKVNIILQLTKGGVTVSGRAVERYLGGHNIGTATTNSKGLVSMNTLDWDAGKYTIGGFFTDDSNKICRVSRTFTVTKAPSTITIDGGNYVKGGVIKFYFKYNGSSAIKNTKVQLYVNGKLKSLKTDKNGRIVHQFDSKGTFKFKAVYKGSKNIEKKEFTTTVTISE